MEAEHRDTSAASCPNLAVSVKNLTVAYYAYERTGSDRIRPGLMKARRRRRRRIEAIGGISFDVALGDSIGLIGANGSGKSTLLRAIAGLVPAESGTVRVRSSPVLMGVGAVLQPTLTGRDNIVQGLLALGKSLNESRRLVEEVTEFSGLGSRIDFPMATYSSGMRARLHFSIATAIQPDILIVDESLAVGDRSFKHRSMVRLSGLVSGSSTVFFVSQNLEPMRSLCNRALWLEDGALVMDDQIDRVIEAYETTVDRER